MSNPSRTYLLVEQRLGQNLRAWVRRRYVDRGMSWNAVALELHEATGLGVRAETLRTWFDDLRRPPKAKPDGAVA